MDMLTRSCEVNVFICICSTNPMPGMIRVIGCVCFKGALGQEL